MAAVDDQVIDLRTPVTATRFAELVGVSQQAISKRISDGQLLKGQSLGVWLVAYCERLREEAAGRSGQDQQSLTRARTREAEAGAQLKELQILEKAGKLVPVEAIEPQLAGMVTAARQELLAMPDRLVTEIKAVHGVEVDPQLISDLINECLEHLAGSIRAGSGEDVVASVSAVGAAAEDDDDGVG